MGQLFPDRFGDSPPFMKTLDQFALYDKNGHAGGLTGTYMVNKESEQRFSWSSWKPPLTTKIMKR
jgi:hypothetical protein